MFPTDFSSPGAWFRSFQPGMISRTVRSVRHTDVHAPYFDQARAWHWAIVNRSDQRRFVG